MKIRLLELNDYQAIYNLWNNTKGMGLRSIDDSYEGIERFLKRNPYTNFVAVLDSEIIGVIMVGNDGRRGFIYHLAVHKKYQRKKIASKLVEQAIIALKKEKINKVALVVFNDNKVGNDFWQSIGFVERDDLVYRNISINEENI